MIKICIADSLPVVIQGLQSFFQGNTRMEVVASAKNLESLLNVLNNKRCDMLLLDVELEGLSSIRDIKSLLKDFPETKIVLFTNVSEQMYAPTAIKAGVSAYVSKRSDLKELEGTIAKVSEGKVVFSESEIKDGQNIWQSIGGQEVGSIWGHGAYVAPDWTADWLHREAVFILDLYAQKDFNKKYEELDSEKQATLKISKIKSQNWSR